MNGLPLTNYQMKYIRLALAGIGALLFLVIFTANIINTLIIDGVSVAEKSYITRDGFPIFTNNKEYIRFVKTYPRDPGVRLNFHTVRKNETLWTIAKRYRVTIDTIIGANPFLASLQIKEKEVIVVPRKNGVLLAFDDYWDVSAMKEKLNFDGTITGEYRPRLLKLISNDEMRLVFFKNSEPEVVNPLIETLYSYHKIFKIPVRGNFTSMFGDRVDPIYHLMAFHSGIDIQAPMGTPIKAARKGMVIYTGWRDGFGKTIIVQHNDGYSTMYSHLSRIIAKKGDWVTKLKTIGAIGSTGRSTGPHLHFMLMHHGKIINPLRLIW